MEVMAEEQKQGHLLAKASVKAVLRRLDDNPYESRMKIYQDIASDYDVSVDTIRLRLTKWDKFGDKGLIPKLKGRKEGDGKFLTDERESEIIKNITDKTPDQIKMLFALWSRQAVQELILEKYNIELVITAVGKYLKKWGITVQKPSVKKPGQRPAAVEKWLNEEYPSIQKKGKNRRCRHFLG
jgi:transposase